MQLEKACAPLYIAFMRNHFSEFDNFDNSTKAMDGYFPIHQFTHYLGFHYEKIHGLICNIDWHRLDGLAN